MPGLAPNGADYGASFLTNSSASLATFAAIRRASSFVSSLAADRQPGFYVPELSVLVNSIFCTCYFLLI
jgi:hypothetical protein